jgi:hypothetical protein
MKKVIFSLLVVLFLVPNLYSQSYFEKHDPPIPLISNTDWAYGDWLVSSTQPFGRPSGIYRTSNNTIYVAVPDTAIVSGKCLAILSSTNNGAGWSVIASYAGTNIDIRRTKIVDAGSDSLYLFYLVGTTLYTYNFISGNFNQYTEYTNIRDFDAVASSTHSLYLFIDVNISNTIYRRGSTNGGVTWPSTGTVTSTGANPRASMSGTGDTLILNYYNTLTADTGSSAIVNFKYRESAPGTISSLGYTTPIAAGTFKDQFLPVLFAGKEWLFYTTGTTGSIDLNCIQSNDNGATFGTPFTIGSLPSRDEYWFDAKFFRLGSGGVDLIWYSDSAQTGVPTNVTDRLYYAYINYATPTTTGAPVQVSEHWPLWSSRLYIPTLIEYYGTSNDAGVIWVGGPSPYKLYYDRYSATTRITNNQSEVANDYSLSQNYPNPFNPVTKIDFSIPKSGMVTIKIYDILGKEVETLLSKEMNPGNHSVDFDAAKLSSGTYFYKLESGSFSKTMKMVLIK